LVDLAEAQAVSAEVTKEQWHELLGKAQRKIMDNIPRENLGKYTDPKIKEDVKRYVLMVVENSLPGTAYQVKQSLVERLTNEINGYGPLEQLLTDEDITEIIVQKHDDILIEKDGALKESNTKFDSEEHLRLVIDRIIAPLGRQFNSASPTVDGRLPDGSRVCAVAPPIAVEGTTITIRKFKKGVRMNTLVEWGAIDNRILEALKACVQARLSIVVSGGTGSGKTTFLNALSEYISKDLSIITIENPVEMQLFHDKVRQFEARPENLEGKGEISMMHLVITALRSRPDIIMVGEVRSKEAYALMQALNTGHNGSMTTLHADTARDAMKRLVSMVVSANELPKELVPEYVASSVDIIVQLQRMPDKSRKLTEIHEVIGEKDGKILTNPLVEYKIESVENGKLQGHWEATGNEFTRLKQIKDAGVDFPGWEK